MWQTPTPISDAPPASGGGNSEDPNTDENNWILQHERTHREMRDRVRREMRDGKREMRDLVRASAVEHLLRFTESLSEEEALQTVSRTVSADQSRMLSEILAPDYVYGFLQRRSFCYESAVTELGSMVVNLVLNLKG